jgi:hypothetical protein
MKRTSIKESKRILNKKSIEKDKICLDRIAKEQSIYLAFEYLCQLVLPSFLRELNFSPNDDESLFYLNGIESELEIDGSIAYLKFRTDLASKTLIFSDIYTKPSMFKIHFKYGEKEYDKQLFGDLNLFFQEILISIRDVWNFSHPNLCFSIFRKDN